MSSPSILVSLCVIRVEIVDGNADNSAEMATKKTRGRREPSEITVENYVAATERPTPLLSSSQGTSKSHSASRANSEEGCHSGDVHSTGDTAAAPFVSPDQISFISGNPFVEVTKGILHLYKEDELTEMRSAADRSHTICILSVPTTMTCHDLLTFTAACHPDIQHFRILRDGNPNQYMALITFRSPCAASEFYETFNGAPYNSLEPDVVCHMVFVSRVEMAENGLALAGHTELPLCPVCLERMDESVDGILTILCNHTFHSSCLVKWGDTSCPVCRYMQTPELLEDSSCMECVASASNDALWICLICGHIGCSRYHHGHAFEHYRDTHHCYAMQLGNNRVWDYVGDNFVHRLLQDKDGKMVEGGRTASKGEAAADEDKMDSVQLEFTYLLTSQLETQRQYFEEKLQRTEQRSLAETAELREKLGQVFEENSKFKGKFETIFKEKQSLEKRLQHANAKLKELQAILTEEKELRRALELNQSSWRSKCDRLEKEILDATAVKQTEIDDLKEQLRDLMFYLDARLGLENAENKEEIAAGTIVIPPRPETPKPSRSRTFRSRKK